LLGRELSHPPLLKNYCANLGVKRPNTQTVTAL